MDNTTWILVADACQAKIFKAIKAKLFDVKADGKDLTLVSEHTHEACLKRDQDLVTDKQGKFGNATFVERTDPKRHENEVFAQEIARVLSSAHNQHNYRDLILIAPPAFIGMINKHLTHEVKKVVSKEIEKDYTRANIKELVSHLRDNL